MIPAEPQTQTHIPRELYVSDRELAAQAILLLAKNRSCGRIVYRHVFFRSNPPPNPQDDGVLVVLVDPDSDEGNRGKIYNMCQDQVGVECVPISVAPDLCLEEEDNDISRHQDSFLHDLQRRIASLSWRVTAGEQLAFVLPWLWVLAQGDNDEVRVRIGFRNDMPDANQAEIIFRLVRDLDSAVYHLSIRGQDIKVEQGDRPRDICARIHKVREPDLPTVMTRAADAFRVMEAETRSWTPSQILPGVYLLATGANDELPAGSILFDRPDLGLRCVFQFRGKTPPSVESGRIADNPAIEEGEEQWDECGQRDGYEGFDDIYPGDLDDVDDTDTDVRT